MKIHCTYCLKETPQKIIKLETTADNGAKYLREYMVCLNCAYPYSYCSDYNIKAEEEALNNDKTD